MDTAKDMWKMIMGNLALIQVTEAHPRGNRTCAYSRTSASLRNEATRSRVPVRTLGNDTSCATLSACTAFVI